MINCGSMNMDTGTVSFSDVGTPQGNVASPILANIVLDNLDKYLENYKSKFEIGKKRALNKEYISLRNKRARSTDPVEKNRLFQEMLKVSAVDRSDPNFKRMLYLRYADDFVVLVTGSHQDALRIKRHIKDYLVKHTGLELNEEKTVVSPTSEPFIFLGASCKRVDSSTKLSKVTGSNIRKRTVPRMRVDLPIDILIKRLRESGFIKNSRSGKTLATARKDLVNLDHNDIVRFYNAKINGIISHYGFARNRFELHRFTWYLRASCAATLALKYKLRTMRATFSNFGKNLASEDGYGLNIPNSFKQLLNFNAGEYKELDIDDVVKGSWASKTTKSNLFKSCLICGTNNKVEMHHIRSVKDVRAK